jgi:UDP-glucuronate 4-epimerase
MAGSGNAQGLRILVTGAAGFIGSHLSERLVAAGHGVWGLDNFDPYYDPAIKRRNVSEVVGHPNMHLVEGDLRDEVLLDGLFGSVPFDLVVHLAARAGVRASLAQPELCLDVNITGTMRLLEAMRRHHVGRLVFASSSSVYGERTAAGGAFRETDPAGHPVSPYAASKRSGELLCHTWHHLWGLSVHCLRFFTVYGPRQRPDLAINKFVRLMKDGTPIPMFGDGTTGRDYTYVGDIVEGVVRSMGVLAGRAAGDPAFEIVNVGRGEIVELNRLIDALAAATGSEAQIDRKPEQPGDVPLTLADTTACREVLGWTPEVGIDEGIRRYVAWLEALEGAGAPA